MAKRSRKGVERQPIPEAVQAHMIKKLFVEHAQEQELPEGAFMLAILNTSPIAPNYRDVAEALKAIGRKDALVVVLSDFDEARIFDRRDMREAGWSWVGAPRDEQLDQDYRQELEDIAAAVAERLNLEAGDVDPLVIDGLLSAYRLKLQADLAVHETAWQRACQVHEDLKRWILPEPKTSWFQRFRLWLYLRIKYRGLK